MVAIYAVSGDPWTKAHTNIVERSLQIVDKVIVAIGVHPTKKYTFPLEKRKKLAEFSLRIALGKYGDRIEVDSFEGLLVDYAYIRGVKLLIRGLRDDIDYNYERSMFQVNITQKGVDELFLFSHPNYGHISSSAVRELQKNQGNILDYVELPVKQAMEVDLSGIRIFGITGTIGAGKTYIANKICGLGHNTVFEGRKEPLDFYNIELDVIARNLLTKDNRRFAVKMRKELLECFEERIVSDSNEEFVDLKKLKPVIFSSRKALFIYNQITKEPILTEARQQIKKPGFYLLNSALLAEGELSSICNNNVLMVSSSEEFRMKNLKIRDYSEEELKRVSDFQMSEGEKIKALQLKKEEQGWGTMLHVINNPDLADQVVYTWIEKMLSITDTDWK